MKKLVICIAAVALSVSVSAQNLSWGVRAGLNISSVSTSGDLEENFDSKVGFNVGVMGDYAFSERFSVESGLYFSQVGIKSKYEDDKITLNLGYLQLPLLATMKFAISDNAKWSVQAGPYFAVGIGGKTKMKETSDGITVSVKTDSFGDGKDENDGDIQRFDMGLTFGTGVTFNRIYVGVKYDLGLSNILSKAIQDADGGLKMKNGNFSINVGYNF